MCTDWLCFYKQLIVRSRGVSILFPSITLFICIQGSLCQRSVESLLCVVHPPYYIINEPTTEWRIKQSLAQWAQSSRGHYLNIALGLSTTTRTGKKTRHWVCLCISLKIDMPAIAYFHSAKIKNKLNFFWLYIRLQLHCIETARTCICMCAELHVRDALIKMRIPDSWNHLAAGSPARLPIRIITYSDRRWELSVAHKIYCYALSLNVRKIHIDRREPRTPRDHSSRVRQTRERAVGGIKGFFLCSPKDNLP